MPVMLLLFLRDPDGDWVADGPAIRYDDEGGEPAEARAERYGERWVEPDPENRRYEIHPY